jgi:hypothetical protein
METALIIYSQGTNIPCVMDLYQNETISLQYSFSDIKDLKAKATYSRTFRVPATTNNAQIFAFIENNTFQFSQFNPKRKFQAIITIDTLPIMEGSIQFKAAYTSNGVVSEYEIVFFGNVIDFFKNIGDADFKNYIGVELNNDYTFVVNYLNILDIMSGIIGDGNIDFTLTDRGENWVGMINSAETRSIYTNNVDKVIKAGNLTPMIKAEYIFNKIMSLSGFELNTDESSTLLGELGKLYIPFTSEASQIQQIRTNAEFAKFKLQDFTTNPVIDYTDFATQSIDGGNPYVYELPSISVVTDEGNNIIVNEFTAPFSGTYLMNASLKGYVDFDTQSASMRVHFVKTDLSSNQSFIGTSTAMQFFEYNQGQIVYRTGILHIQTTNAFIGNSTQQLVYLAAGEKIRPVLRIANDDLAAQSLQPVTSSFTLLSPLFQCTAVSQSDWGNDIDWVANAPVMKCTEFMSALFKMFNLVVIPDKFNPKLLSFIPLDEYLSTGDYKDWSNIIDINKDIILTPTTDYQAQINNWSYKKSDDYLNDLYNTQGNRVYGRLQLLDPENDFATEEQKIELEFGSTPLALIEATDYPIAKFINNSGDYVNPTPRILYRTGDTMTIHILNDDTNLIDNAFVLPMFSHYNAITPDITSVDYNFGQETPLHPTINIPYQTLYQRYWNNYVANIYAPDARIMEAFFSLEFADIYNFRFNDKIFIRDSYWRILEIKDYVVGMQESVQVKLMKIIDVAAPCNLTIDSVSNALNVLFIDPDGNISNGTQTCCESYGYDWNAAQGRCYAVRQDGGNKKSFTDKNYVITNNVDDNPSDRQFINGQTNVVDAGNENSIVTGSSNYLGEFNDNSFVAGTNLVVMPNVGGSITMIGDKGRAINKGITIGGNGSYIGEVQSGIIHLWGKGDFTNNTTFIDLKIGGNNPYNMPSDTMWILKILLSGLQDTGADGTISGEYNLHMVNRGGTISFINATTIDETMDNMNGYLVFDVVINAETFYPKIKLVNSSTYPENNMKFSALTTYVQYHYE